MKCPNCSFENSDDSKQCKICGYDLPIQNPPPKKRFAEDENDEELDSALKSLFGLDEDTTGSNDEDHLDVATVERMLHKKRQPSQEQAPATPPSQQQGRVRTPQGSTTSKDSNEPPQYSLKVIFAVIVVLMIMLLIFKSGLIKLPWKYQSDQDQATTVASTETAETTETIEPTTEFVVNLWSEAPLVPVNAFYDYLPEFVNKGNLNILTLFKSSQEALNVLTTFASEGNLESIVSSSLTQSEINDSDATFTVETVLNRLIQGEQTQTLTTWDFHIVLDSAEWYIDSLGVTSESYTGTTTDEGTTQASTEETTQATTQSTTQGTTAPTTEAEPFDYSGFITSGTFTGGKSLTGQDVGTARYGNHNDFDRIVFDLYKWIGGSPVDTVDEITTYTANISSDGKKITIILSGAMDAYASTSPIDLAGSPNIESVKFSLSGPNESVQIDISLKNASQYKVFNLKSPARLVVDIAPK